MWPFGKKKKKNQEPKPKPKKYESRNDNGVNLNYLSQWSDGSPHPDDNRHSEPAERPSIPTARRFDTNRDDSYSENHRSYDGPSDRSYSSGSSYDSGSSSSYDSGGGSSDF